MEIKSKKFSLGTFVCIFNKEVSKIFLLKRSRKEKQWGNVGGMVEIGEKVVDACVREVKEEIGINLNPEKLRLIDIKETPNFSEFFHALHFIYATTLDEEEKIQINEESENFGWFKLDELPDKILDSQEYLTLIANKIKNNKEFFEKD